MSRFYNYPEAEVLQSDDVFLIDGETDGTRKIPANKMADFFGEQVPTDKTLAVSNMAADAKVVGDEIGEIKSAISDIEPGLSDTAKVALLNCFQHVAWIDEQGQTYYDALETALYADDYYPRITAEYNSGGDAIYTDDNLDTLKHYLTVKYYETAESAGTVVASADYTLSGTLTEGISRITVSYDSINTTFDVVVTQSEMVYEIANGTDLSGQTINTGISAFGIDDDFTILASVKVLAVPTSTSTSYVLISNGTIGNHNILRLSIDEKNGIEYYVTNYAYGDSYQDVYTPGTVYANTTHDVIWIMRNHNRQLKKQLYIDGTIRVNKTDDLAQYSSSVFSGNYTVGGFTANSPAPISAVVDLFKIFDTALSASKIDAILGTDFAN